ncbi:hypothetical protein EYF80_046161 [Liparis tanakae]|uniref:Uncharacterized protein n=1 Tax=Liparis tanakae TaxID=230148 RepID=A0A4Z2FRN8_9TELE|nr:hypothetical protein EYF80_046161 [Liparis tanakae]
MALEDSSPPTASASHVCNEPVSGDVLDLSLKPLLPLLRRKFDVLKVLGELHADAGHHVFRDELPLAGVVVQLVQDLLE